MTQLMNDVEAYFDAVNQLRNDLWDAHSALEHLESFVERLERQAQRPYDCRCAEQAFATIEDEGTICVFCHERWLACQPVTYEKPRYLMGR